MFIEGQQLGRGLLILGRKRIQLFFSLREGSVVEQPLRVRYLRKDGGILTVSVVGALTTWRGRPAVQVMIRPDKPGAD